MSTLRVAQLGRVEYEDGRELQRRFREARTQGWCEDTLFLLEHPPVITLGRGGRRENVIWSDEQLSASGLTVHEVERGGDVTYHGPGQVVGYPVLDLAPHRKDVRRYVRDLEEVLIRALKDVGVAAERVAGWPGVFVKTAETGGLAKIAALGVHISRWVTMHGFALNLDPDLTHFASIVPCGIREAGVTSVARQLGQAPSREIMEAALIRAFADVFDADLQPSWSLKATVAVYCLRSAGPRTELLLLKRRPERGGFWQPVTGRVEAGETPSAAAARETEEETGAVRAVTALGYQHDFAHGQRSPPELIRETAFACRWNGAPLRLSEEHESAEWVKLPEALQRLPFVGLQEGARRAAASFLL